MISFDVIGTPAPKGSSRAIIRGKRAVVVQGSSNVGLQKLQSWSAEVTAQAVQAMAGAPPIVGSALHVSIAFRFARPAGHYARSGSLKPSAPTAYMVRPDLDKLVRSSLDSLTGIVFDDDSRIACVGASKAYCQSGEAPGATITVSVVAAGKSRGKK